MNTLDERLATPNPIHELNTHNVIAVVAVDRGWATAALVHADPLGNLYPFQWGTAFTADTPSASPHALLADTVERAWSNMAAKGAPRYETCLLCLPSSLTKGREATGRIRIESGKDPGAAPRVTPEAIAELQESVCTQNVSASFTATDLEPHAYADDTGHEIPNPLGLVTTTLELRAHVVMTETTALTAALDALRRLRIRVHGLVSPYKASAAHLPPDIPDRDALIVELGDRDTIVTTVKNGTLVGTTSVETGAHAILRLAARRLSTRGEHLADWLTEHDVLATHGSDATRLASDPPPGTPAPATLGELDALLADAAVPVARTVIETLRRPTGHAEPQVVSYVVSDHRFAGRALASALSACSARTFHLTKPKGIHAADRVRAPGLTRLTGCVRGWRSGSQTALPVLSAYYGKRSAARRAQRLGRRDGARFVTRPIAGVAETLNNLVRAVQAFLF